MRLEEFTNPSNHWNEQVSEHYYSLDYSEQLRWDSAIMHKLSEMSVASTGLKFLGYRVDSINSVGYDSFVSQMSSTEKEHHRLITDWSDLVDIVNLTLKLDPQHKKEYQHLNTDEQREYWTTLRNWFNRYNDDFNKRGTK